MTFFWWRRQEQVWKGCIQIRDRFAMRRLKESDRVHPQRYPHTQGRFQKYLGEKHPVRLPKQNLTHDLITEILNSAILKVLSS